MPVHQWLIKKHFPNVLEAYLEMCFVFILVFGSSSTGDLKRQIALIESLPEETITNYNRSSPSRH